uniref:Uncharacterized protein n=1 Tax=Rhizophora mucronata TaxID=61149 RepID=A0A2P2NRV5_RHIMU
MFALALCHLHTEDRILHPLALSARKERKLQFSLAGFFHTLE